MIGEANNKDNPNGELIEINDSVRNHALRDETSYSLEYLHKPRNDNLSSI